MEDLKQNIESSLTASDKMIWMYKIKQTLWP